MKKILLICKYPLLILINTVPFVLDVVFYSNGGMDNLSFLLVYAVLTIFNYNSFNKVSHYLIIQAYLLVCLISSGCISTHLYYNNISDDPMTPAIGMLLVYAGSIFVVIITIITSIVKKKSKTIK